MFEQPSTRRDVLQKAAYVTPAILTLAALPSFASAGSGNNNRTFRRRQRGEKERQRDSGETN
jgi:hypothetical protein